MTDTISMHGVEARLVWGYLQAGTVGAWTLTRATPNDPGSITATVNQVDSFRVSQRPLEFVVTHKYGTWRWPIQTLQINGASLTAVLARTEQ